MIIENVLGLPINFVNSFGYIIIFLATFLEASPFFGIFVPGSWVIFFGGFLARLNIVDGPLFSLRIVMTFAALGAIFGDLGGYLFGRYFGKEFLHKYGKYLLIKREYIDKSCNLAHNHTGKSLVLGRLNPVTRSAAPFIVGAHKVNFWKFMLFNIIGGVLWVFLFSTLGFFFGQNYKLANDIEKTILYITLGMVLLLYIYYFIKSLNEKRNKEECI